MVAMPVRTFETIFKLELFVSVPSIFNVVEIDFLKTTPAVIP